MSQFLKSFLSFIPCFFVVLMGCTNTKTSKEFSHTMEDGGRVNIKIEYKSKSKISGDEKFGFYYYIVQYIVPKPSPSAKTSEQQDKNKSQMDLSGIDGFRDSYRSTPASPPVISISFYDRNGYLLWYGFTPHFRSPNYTSDHKADEQNQIEGGWELKGRFDESSITLENFRDIHSIKVE